MLQAIQIARAYLGITEMGINKGKQVEQFQKSVDGIAQGESWCMAFMMFVIRQTELVTGFKSPLFRSEHCLTVWNKSPSYMRLSKPEAGALVIWQAYTKDGKATTSGHTGLILSVSGTTMQVIEGNTNQSGSREGDGVYIKTRNLSTPTGTLRIKGFLRLFPS